jgi:hypothetical protein
MVSLVEIWYNSIIEFFALATTVLLESKRVEIQQWSAFSCPNNLVQTVGPREKFKTANLKEAPVSENAPLQSQRHATKFAIEWVKKHLSLLYHVSRG